MSVKLLLGDEAVAQAAIDAGIAGAFSYPGTPATEIFETILNAHHPGISARWSANEKVAYEEALGMSYTGRRAIVSMKHVGLNVAADPFINSAITGVNGGVVLAVADDPGMHSSQNEQDSRYYAEFAHVPAFEPATQQEAYDLTLQAFEYSERIGLPVMLRLVTRLSHSRANVTVHGELKTGNGKGPWERRKGPRERRKASVAGARPMAKPENWTLVPAIARKRFAHLMQLQQQLVEDSETSTANTLKLAGSRGIIATGLAHNYVMEALESGGDFSILKVSQYPAPVTRIRELVDHCDEILVVEEGYPFLERQLNGLLGVPGKAIKGKLTGDLPRTGELNADSVARALGRTATDAWSPVEDLAGRPPQLCHGCPHGDSFKALVEATAKDAHPLLFSDIGCYTLGVLPPYRAVHSCVDMGASIAMAHGAAQAGVGPVICTIGDSTFAHSGMTPLLGAARADANMTVMILDNGTVAMTGNQDSLASGDRLVELLLGLNVKHEHIRVIEPVPRKHAENVDIIRREIEHPGLSVIVAARECIHLKRKLRDQALRDAENAESAPATPV
jgi:indolepyruvate ferredoxin oxidoreductase alpha subunit